MAEATAFAKGVDVYDIRLEVRQQLSEPRDGSGGSGQLLAATASGDRGEKVLIG
jgi:hypothetical protein